MLGSQLALPVRAVLLPTVGEPASRVAVDLVPPVTECGLVLLGVVLDTAVSSDRHRSSK